MVNNQPQPELQYLFNNLKGLWVQVRHSLPGCELRLLGMPTGSEWATKLNLHQPRKHHLLHPGDSLRPFLIQFKCCSRLIQLLSLMGSQQAASGLGVPWAFC